MTNDELQARFDEDGFVQLKGFFSAAEIDGLRADIESAGRALDDESALNKGQMVFLSNIYQRSESLQRFICQQRLVDFLAPIIGPDFWVRWDQCVCKGPGAPAFPWHQDNAYNDLKVPHFQLWVAVTPTTADNGGLWLAPGSHKLGLLAHHKVGKHQVVDEAPEQSVLVEAQKGDVVLFSSYMLHHTKENVSTQDRWAYVIEYMHINDFDPFIKAPFLIAAEHGKTARRFTDVCPGSQSLRNQVKYHGIGGTAKRLVKAAVGSPD